MRLRSPSRNVTERHAGAARRTLAGLLCAVACHCFLATDVQASQLDLRDWQQVTSDNFRMYTVLSRERSLEMLHHLETMRAAIGTGTSGATYASATPTTIVAVDGRDDYISLGAPPNSVGFFLSDIRENTIVVLDEAGIEGIETMLHEYVHFLNHSSGRVLRPRWFEEGSAEYLSASRIDGDMFEYGLPQKDRLMSLHLMPWVPVDKLLTIMDTSTLGAVEGGQFYGQSWLLYHYLMNRDAESDDLEQQLLRYGQLVARGQQPIPAFERAFGVNSEALVDILMDYLQAGDFPARRVPIGSFGGNPNVDFRATSRGQIQVVLGNTAMQFGNIDSAEAWYRAALDDGDWRAYGESGLGRVAAKRGNIEAALVHFDKAIYQVAWDFRIWMDFAQFWALRLSETQSFRDRRSYARRLHEALDSALTIDSATPELNSLRGLAYLAEGGELANAIAALRAAAEQSPTDQPSRYLLANAYLANGDFQLAISTAQSILALEHESNELTVATTELINSARNQRRLRD